MSKYVVFVGALSKQGVDGHRERLQNPPVNEH